MLEKLDTLIAFAVVMLGISLIITILTQIISAALGLRGSNLLWGLEALFKQLAPGLEAAGLAPRDLAKEILHDESISDSLFSRAENMRLVGPIVKFLNARPVTAWLMDRWRYATAIRPEELVRVLQTKIAALPVGNPARAELSSLLEAANAETVRKLTMLNDALRNIAPVAPAAAPAFPGPGPAAAAPALAANPNYAVQVDKIFQQVTDTAGRSVGKLEAWFSSSMDRVTQRFVVQVRMWTVAFAFLLAFGAHLDSLRLLDQLWTNPEARAALVNMRDGMLGEAKSILPRGRRGGGFHGGAHLCRHPARSAGQTEEEQSGVGQHRRNSRRHHHGSGCGGMVDYTGRRAGGRRRGVPENRNQRAARAR